MKPLALQVWLTSLTFGCLVVGNSAAAQIIPDNTLPVNSSVTQEANTSKIEGGTVRGTNLFHSFREFSVFTGGEAFFNNAAEIRNILTRVTGNNLSNIDGLIRANGTANLFLMNPNGIIFGSNARLDIGGSFLGTTANAIEFGKEGLFSATTPEVPSELLTVNPSALLFNQIAAARIQNNSVADSGLDQSGTIAAKGLRVPDGQSLLLVGGNVSMDGGGLFAFGGRVELGGLAGAGTVGLNGDGSNLSLSFPDGVERSDVLLTNMAEVNVRAGGGGSIAINARNLELAGTSALRAGIVKGLGSVSSKARNIEVNAQGAVNLKDKSFIANTVLLGAIGNAGDISITTGSLSVTNGAELLTSTLGKGDAGNITINARDTVSFDGIRDRQPSLAASNVDSEAEGKGGNILITTSSLSVTNGAQLVSSILKRGKGDAGNITIHARDTVSFDGIRDGEFSLATSDVESGGVGNGGNILITTGSLSVTNGAELITSTHGKGNAGNITIHARDTVSFDEIGVYPSLATSSVATEGVGNGGEIFITTGSLSVTNGAGLFSSTLGQGDAGNITIHARDTVSFDGIRDGEFSGAYSSVDTKGEGKGGDIFITTGSLSVTNGAGLFASTERKGNAGNITINARDTVSFNAGNAYSSVGTEGEGKGGDIFITTGSLSLTNGAELSASSDGQGTAGDIKIASRSIRLDNKAKITATTASGNGGDITLTTQDLLLLRRNSQISTSAGTAQQGGDGGNITVDAPNGFVVAVPKEDSDITANAFNGQGGNIKITAREVFGIQPRERQTPESDITASSELGIAGTVQVNTSNLDPSRGFVELPVNLVDPSTQIAQGCTPGSNVASRQNRFTITGRGGLPASLNEIFPGEETLVELLELPHSKNSHDATSQNILVSPRPPSGSQSPAEGNPPAALSHRVSASSSHPQEIVEAQGWVVDADGAITLVAEVPNTTPHSPSLTPASCQTSMQQ
jgi:filamentous hemagglutinin family protein